MLVLDFSMQKMQMNKTAKPKLLKHETYIFLMLAFSVNLNCREQ